MKAVIRCKCGHRIVQKEVVQTGLYWRQYASSYVYVKYRCSHCKQFGEQLVDESVWDASILQDYADELTDAERERFQKLAQIDVNGLIDFHRQLAGTSRISADLFATAGSKVSKR